jgi:hypothetical protein
MWPANGFIGFIGAYMSNGRILGITGDVSLSKTDYGFLLV